MIKDENIPKKPQSYIDDNIISVEINLELGEDFDRNKTAGQLLIGLDFGFTNDPTALVASLLDEENKRIYVFKEWGATGKTNEEIAEVIKALGFAKSTIIADAAEPKSVEEIRRLGVQRIKASVKGGGSILHGIQKLQQYELINFLYSIVLSY